MALHTYSHTCVDFRSGLSPGSAFGSRSPSYPLNAFHVAINSRNSLSSAIYAAHSSDVGSSWLRIMVVSSCKRF